jgi:hypothetical protein
MAQTSLHLNAILAAASLPSTIILLAISVLLLKADKPDFIFLLACQFVSFS